MNVLLTFVSTNRRGRTQRDSRRVDATLVTIGRGSKSELHLADPRVAYVHAKIALLDGHATIEAAEGPVEVNGRSVAKSGLVPGDTVRIGPYRIEVETPPADVALALAVTAGVGTASGESLRRAIARAPRLSKRRLSYIAFFGVLLLTLIVPLAGDWVAAYATRSEAHPALAEIAPSVAHRFLQTWSPGALSRSHQVFGSDCRACHQYAFLQVRDSACIACHTTIAEHVPRAELTGPRGVAFAKTRCAECHRDHKTTHMAPQAQEECAACHADVKSAAPAAKSENVTDFGADHPQFRVSLIDANRADAVRRVRLQSAAPAELVERSNLKFDHALHMNPAGVRDPENRVSVLKCSGCHKPDDGGRVMQPISMERDCRRCHSLAFEPKVTKREVPHGSAEDAATVLREFYARLALGDTPPGVTPPPDLPRMRPGAVLSYEERQQVLRIADERAQRVMRELFETRAVCSTCHYVNRDEREGWKVAPVRLTRVWMPQALFSHEKHATESCTACHDSDKSKKATDIAMPGVEVCQACHVGARPVLGKVTSDCASCHEFHAGRNYWHDALQTRMLSKDRK